MTTYRTHYGPIHAGGRCKDDYDNIRLYHQPGRGSPIKLQGPAMRSFKACERRYAELTRPKHKSRPINCTGTWRACSYQRELYSRDSKRYAHPDSTLHTRGLAIDVVNPVPQLVRRILLAHGWKQSRPMDEPWHFSYHLSA